MSNNVLKTKIPLKGQANIIIYEKLRKIANEEYISKKIIKIPILNENQKIIPKLNESRKIPLTDRGPTSNYSKEENFLENKKTISLSRQKNLNKNKKIPLTDRDPKAHNLKEDNNFRLKKMENNKSYSNKSHFHSDYENSNKIPNVFVPDFIKKENSKNIKKYNCKLRKLESIYSPKKNSQNPITIDQYLLKKQNDENNINNYNKLMHTPEKEYNLSRTNTYSIWDNDNLLIKDPINPENINENSGNKNDFLKFLKLRIEDFPAQNSKASKKEIVYLAKKLVGPEKIQSNDFNPFKVYDTQNDLNYLKFLNFFYKKKLISGENRKNNGKNSYIFGLPQKKNKYIPDFKTRNVENGNFINPRFDNKSNGLKMTPDFERIFGKHKF